MGTGAHSRSGCLATGRVVRRLVAVVTLVAACAKPAMQPTPKPPDTPVDVSSMIDARSPAMFSADSAALYADSDADGVLNRSDRCPSTPAGARVDANGCPLAPDADHDGVEDSRDRCPNTATGKSVDTVGCPIAPVGNLPGRMRLPVYADTIITRVPPLSGARQLFRSHYLRPQGQFETSAELERRRQRLPSGRRAVTLDPRCVETNYDADSERVTVQLQHLYERRSLLVLCSRRVAGSRSAQNGFGARFRVSTVYDTTLALATTGELTPEYQYGLTWTIPLSRTRARAMLRNLEVAVIAETLPFEIEEAEEPYEATTSAPVEGASYTATLVTGNWSLVLRDRTSGAIVAARRFCVYGCSP